MMVPVGREFALVDDEDYERVINYTWHVFSSSSGAKYARTTINGKKVLMHRLLEGCPDRDVQIDHKDGNGLNNLKANRRRCDHQQNHQARRRKPAGSSSKFRGVSWHKRIGRWQAQIERDEINHCLGYFDCEELAARTRDRAAKKLFGPHAQLNFP